MVKAIKKVTFQMNTTTGISPTKTIIKPKGILKKPQSHKKPVSPTNELDVHENCNNEIKYLQQLCANQVRLLEEQNKIIQRLTLCLAEKNGN